MKRVPLICPVLAVAAFAIWVQACRIATRPVNPDENQFVASALLLAREGKRPYVDYPYMHLPHQTLMLGGIYRLGADHLLLTARIMTGTFGLLTLVLVAGLIVAAGRRTLAAWLLALTAVAALLFNPLFAYTSGLAWNHDASMFLVLCSIAALWRGMVTRRPIMFGAAGVFIGLAVGVRSTMAPLGMPMLVFVVWQVFVRKTLPWRTVFVFVAGGVIAQIPTLILAAMAPERFWWGNVGYALLNTRHREETAFEHAMTLREKWRYLREVVFPWDDHRRGDLLLLVWGAVMSVGAWVLGRNPRRSLDAHIAASQESRTCAPLGLLMALLPFALVGALLPTPSWVQYYYALMPLGVLAAGAAVANAVASGRFSSRASSVVVIAAVSSLTLVAVESVRQLTSDERCLNWPATVVPMAVHDEGRQLATLTRGRVLTIDPIYALEGGLPIFPELASGPYAFRVAQFLSADDRRRLLIVGPDEIAQRVADERTSPALLVREPRAVGDRLSHEDDEAIRAFGLRNSWRAMPLDPRHTLLQP